MPLLAGFLFGIIQYGYGLFQYQAFSSSMSDAASIAATGIKSCSQLTGTAADLVKHNGLPIDADHPLQVQVQWLAADGFTKLALPVRYGYAQVTGTYTGPLNFHVPLVPFPDRFVVSKQQMVQDLVPGVTDNLLGCAQAIVAPA